MKITEAKALDPFRVLLRFGNGAAGTVDLSGFAGRGVFEAWLCPGVFEQLSIGPGGALKWPGDLDLCPDALYLQLTGKTAGGVFPALHGSRRWNNYSGAGTGSAPALLGYFRYNPRN